MVFKEYASYKCLFGISQVCTLVLTPATFSNEYIMYKSIILKWWSNEDEHSAFLSGHFYENSDTRFHTKIRIPNVKKLPNLYKNYGNNNKDIVIC